MLMNINFFKGDLFINVFIFYLRMKMSRMWKRRVACVRCFRVQDSIGVNPSFISFRLIIMNQSLFCQNGVNPSFSSYFIKTQCLVKKIRCESSFNPSLFCSCSNPSFSPFGQILSLNTTHLLSSLEVNQSFSSFRPNDTNHILRDEKFYSIVLLQKFSHWKESSTE